MTLPLAYDPLMVLVYAPHLYALTTATPEDTDD